MQSTPWIISISNSAVVNNTPIIITLSFATSTGESCVTQSMCMQLLDHRRFHATKETVAPWVVPIQIARLRSEVASKALSLDNNYTSLMISTTSRALYLGISVSESQRFTDSMPQPLLCTWPTIFSLHPWLSICSVHRARKTTQVTLYHARDKHKDVTYSEIREPKFHGLIAATSSMNLVHRLSHASMALRLLRSSSIEYYPGNITQCKRQGQGYDSQ